MNYFNLPSNTTFLISQKALILKNGELMILKSTTVGAGGADQWELPGGLLELDESMTMGLKREVLEETNVQIEIKQLVTSWDHWVNDFHLNDERVLNVRIVELAFQCDYVSGHIQLSDEHSEYLWCKLKNLANFTFSENSSTAITFLLENDLS